MDRIGLGGGCHWCTEAIFQSLKGVSKVEQGFIASQNDEELFSEAVIVHYDKRLISLKDLIKIHLHTHKSTSAHSMRNKYRSAIYAFDKDSMAKSQMTLNGLQEEFENPIITKVLPFEGFKSSDTQFHNYYYSNPTKPFCESYISPKLKLLLRNFSELVHEERVNRSGELP